MPRRMSTIVEAVPQLIASATLHVDTPGVGFVEITENAVSFVKQAGAGEGVLLIYLRHTSASLTIQENADPDVQGRAGNQLRRSFDDGGHAARHGLVEELSSSASCPFAPR